MAEFLGRAVCLAMVTALASSKVERLWAYMASSNSCGVTRSVPIVLPRWKLATYHNNVGEASSLYEFCRNYRKSVEGILVGDCRNSSNSQGEIQEQHCVEHRSHNSFLRSRSLGGRIDHGSVVCEANF